MNYKIILDEDMVKDYIDNFLPDLEVHEAYYISLFARKKYSPDLKYIKSDKSQLARKTSNKANLFWKIKQLECEVGSFRQQQNMMPIPQEALALYIMPNPRDLYKATLKGLSVFANLIELQNKTHNPHQEIMSVIQKTSSRKIWSLFDIDSKEDGILEKVDDALQGHKECRRIVETRGGYHVLVNLKSIPEEIKRTWHQKIATLSDVTGDALTPIPGCTQGGYTPHFIS